jgi:hypothetical protein
MGWLSLKRGVARSSSLIRDVQQPQDERPTAIAEALHALERLDVPQADTAHVIA